MHKSGYAFCMLLMTLVTGPVAAGGRPIPMVEILDAPVIWASGVPGNISTVQVAILQGCSDKGWIGHVVSPGLIHAVLTRSDYSAQIDIPFDVNTYSIKYSASEHLDYDAKKHVIHRNFNRWLVLLRERIDMHVMDASNRGGT